MKTDAASPWQSLHTFILFVWHHAGFFFFRMWRAIFATPSRFQLYQKMFTTHVSHTYCIFAIFFYWFSRALEWYVRHQLETLRAIKTVGLAESCRNPSSSQNKARSLSWVESLAKLSEREGVDMHSSSVSQFKVLTFRNHTMHFPYFVQSRTLM